MIIKAKRKMTIKSLIVSSRQKFDQKLMALFKIIIHIFYVFIFNKNYLT